MKAVQVLQTGVVYYTGEWEKSLIPLPVLLYDDKPCQFKVDSIEGTAGLVVITEGDICMALSAENVAIIGSKKEMLGE